MPDARGDAAVHHTGGVPVSVAAPDSDMRAVLARLLPDAGVQPTLADAVAAVIGRSPAVEVERVVSRQTSARRREP
ncbi:hypothetical protein [Actinacidiphila acidipaludis]|uniref:Uncharacterized protein n=1 Tax=Actinacidiphila acidipaludis TaxID=2873382 RepID=A0ABS7QIP3_9ACTN|nr:hypothetical protein [Streptomyces acidipaludis]MBY8883040.1 hypothetical protein [Streptomyces acidipaludis]